jgi:DNA-directed RNA polymerase specialized sigma subunit
MSSPDLTREEEEILIKDAKNGNISAQNKIISHNLKGVIQFIKPFHNTQRYDKDDLFQEGAIGIMKAIKSYNPDKGLPFKNYVLYSIKKHILNYSEKNSFYHKVPLYLKEVYNKIKKIEYMLETGTEKNNISTKKLSEELNLSKSTIEKCLEIYRNCNTLSLEEWSTENEI